MDTTQIAQRRQYRNQAAAYLASLENEATSDHIARINWDSLEQVPYWCFEQADHVNKLQLVCGAVFLAPAIRNWIDGKRLREVKALIGPLAFASVIRGGVVGGLTADADITESVPEALARGGAAVLLGSIHDTDIQAVLATQFPMPVEAIDHSIARTVYDIAHAIVQHAAASEKQPVDDTETEATVETSA